MDKLNFDKESTMFEFKEELTNLVSKSFDFDGDTQYAIVYIAAWFAFTINLARSHLEVPEEVLNEIYKSSARVYNDMEKKSEGEVIH